MFDTLLVDVPGHDVEVSYTNTMRPMSDGILEECANAIDEVGLVAGSISSVA